MSSPGSERSDGSCRRPGPARWGRGRSPSSTRQAGLPGSARDRCRRRQASNPGRSQSCRAGGCSGAPRRRRPGRSRRQQADRGRTADRRGTCCLAQRSRTGGLARRRLPASAMTRLSTAARVFMLIVMWDPHNSQAGDALVPGAFGQPRPGGRSEPGQPEAERRADADLALDGQAPRVDPRDPLADRQAQPEAADRARPRLVHAVEPLEEARQVLGGDPAAGVGDDQRRRRRRQAPPRARCARRPACGAGRCPAG